MNEDNKAQPNLTIHIQSGSHVGRKYTFSKDRITLGRSSSNDIVLDSDACISAHHAQIIWNRDHWEIEDRNSKNGVFVEHDGSRQKVLDMERVSFNDLYLLGLTLIRMSANEDCGYPEIKSSDNLHHEHKLTQVLRITAMGEEIRFQLLTDDACAAEYVVAFRPDELTTINESIRVQIQKARMLSGPSSEDLSYELGQIGKLLASELIPKRLQQKLLGLQGGSLFLILDPRLISIPWELIELNGKALCILFEIGRQVIVEDFTAHKLPNLQPSLAGMLIAADPTNDYEPARNQAESLFRFLCKHSPQLDVRFIAGDRLTRSALMERLNNLSCVYFNGHIEYNDAHPGKSAWILQNDKLCCEDFRKLTRPPDFVFANGCESCREPEWNGTENSYGMASAFLLSGVRTYVGTLWPIPVVTSGDFAHFCFSRLIEGASIGEALRYARIKLKERNEDMGATWASYVLYGNPSNHPIIIK